MAIREWSASKLRRIWAYGLALELVLIVGMYALGTLNEPPEPPAFRALRLHDDSVARGLLPPPRELTPAQTEAIRAFLRDSLGITWQATGGTTHVKLPPVLERATARAIDGLRASITAALIVAAMIYLPIPLTLVATTLIWWFQHRRHRRGTRSILPAPTP